MAKAVQTKVFKETLIPQGSILIGNSPQEFKTELQDEVAFWAEQFKKANIGN